MNMYSILQQSHNSALDFKKKKNPFPFDRNIVWLEQDGDINRVQEKEEKVCLFDHLKCALY